MLCNCGTDLRPSVILYYYINERSKATLLLWFYLFLCFSFDVCAGWTLCTENSRKRFTDEALEAETAV